MIIVNSHNFSFHKMAQIDRPKMWVETWLLGPPYMMFNQEKFQYISYHMGDSSKINNIYLSPDHNILPKSGEVKDLGILMSENCDFDSHIASVAKKCSRLCGWILRTFSTCSKSVLLTLFKSIVLPHLDYGSQFCRFLMKGRNSKFFKIDFLVNSN